MFTAPLLKLEHSKLSKPHQVIKPLVLLLPPRGRRQVLADCHIVLPPHHTRSLIHPSHKFLRHQFCAGPLLDTENSAVKKQTKPLSGKAVRV